MKKNDTGGKARRRGSTSPNLMAKEQVRRLQVAMEDPVVVQVVDAAEELQHDALDLRLQQRLLDGLEQLLQVVLHKLHHDEDVVNGRPNDNLVHAHNVFLLGLWGGGGHRARWLELPFAQWLVCSRR